MKSVRLDEGQVGLGPCFRATTDNGRVSGTVCKTAKTALACVQYPSRKISRRFRSKYGGNVDNAIVWVKEQLSYYEEHRTAETDVRPDLVRDHVIQFGNHWLQTDDHRTITRWVGLALATRHTKEWAERYADFCQQALHQIVRVLPIAVAIEQERTRGLEVVKIGWLNRFESLVRQLYVSYTSDGLWNNAHMYYGAGLSVQEAADRFGDSGIKQLRRRLSPKELNQTKQET